MKGRTYNSTTVEESAKSGTQVVGDHRWVTLAKAWNTREEWMKSTKAMEVPGGVLIQVTTLERLTGLAEALTFVPGVQIAIDEATGLGSLCAFEESH